MYLPDITGAGPLLVGPAFFARQRLDLVPRLLLDVAGATFLVIALLFIGLNLYGAAYRAYSARALRGRAPTAEAAPSGTPTIGASPEPASTT